MSKSTCPTIKASIWLLLFRQCRSRKGKHFRPRTSRDADHSPRDFNHSGAGNRAHKSNRRCPRTPKRANLDNGRFCELRQTDFLVREIMPDLRYAPPLRPCSKGSCSNRQTVTIFTWEMPATAPGFAGLGHEVSSARMRSGRSEEWANGIDKS